MQSIRLEQIHPYVRHARYLNMNTGEDFPRLTSYDNRIFYCVDGVGKITTQNKQYSIPKGGILLIKSGIPYTIHSTENTSSYIVLSYDFLYNFFDRKFPIPPDIDGCFKPEGILEDITITDLTELNGVFFLKNISEIKRMLVEIVSECSKMTSYNANRISGLLSCIFSEISLKIHLKRLGTNAYELKLNEIIEYINYNYYKELTVTFLGEKFKYHPNYLNRIMKSYTGYSLHKYITKIRISEAITLMEQTNFKINEIAKSVGFDDACYFSKVFKAQTGKSPKDYISH